MRTAASVLAVCGFLVAVSSTPAADAMDLKVTVTQTDASTRAPCSPWPTLTYTTVNTDEHFMLRVRAWVAPCRPIDVAAAVYRMPDDGSLWPQTLAVVERFQIRSAGATEITFAKTCQAAQFDVITGATPATIAPWAAWHGPPLFPGDTATSFQHHGCGVPTNNTTEPPPTTTTSNPVTSVPTTVTPSTDPEQPPPPIQPPTTQAPTTEVPPTVPPSVGFDGEAAATAVVAGIATEAPGAGSSTTAPPPEPAASVVSDIPGVSEPPPDPPPRTRHDEPERAVIGAEIAISSQPATVLSLVVVLAAIVLIGARPLAMARRAAPAGADTTADEVADGTGTR